MKAAVNRLRLRRATERETVLYDHIEMLQHNISSMLITAGQAAEEAAIIRQEEANSMQEAREKERSQIFSLKGQVRTLETERETTDRQLAELQRQLEANVADAQTTEAELPSPWVFLNKYNYESIK